MRVVRRILKCIVPCIRRSSRSPTPESGSNTQENKTLENCKDTTHRRIGDQYEALIRAERQHELIDIQKMTRDEDTFWRLKWTKESPHSEYFDGVTFEETERGGRREDFKVLGILGEGKFGSVVLAKKKSTGGRSCSEEMLALKFVSNKLVSEIEKDVFFRAVGHPFLVQLQAYFQTRRSMCYVMEYIEGGTLSSLLRSRKRFHEDVARFYAAEVILAVNFLHKCGIVHRDIKPANILLDRDGHCKLADFGLCKGAMYSRSKTRGFVGTKPYMAPEIRRDDLHGPEVDWWSVGCVVYEMMLGKCRDSNVCVHRERFPSYLTKDAVSVLKKFLHHDPRRRLGALGDTRSILRHRFFKTVNWEAVLDKRVTPPIKPPTLKFLNIELDAPGDAEDIGRNPSIGNRHHEAILEAPLNQDSQLVPEATFNQEAPLVLEAAPDLDAPAEQDAAPEHVKNELSALEDEVEELNKILQEKDVELEQLYVKRMHCAATTGEEGHLLEQEETPPHFSLWRKVKLVACGVLVGLVAFVLVMAEIEIKFTDETDWKICFELK